MDKRSELLKTRVSERGDSCRRRRGRAEDSSTVEVGIELLFGVASLNGLAPAHRSQVEYATPRPTRYQAERVP